MTEFEAWTGPAPPPPPDTTEFEVEVGKPLGVKLHKRQQPIVTAVEDGGALAWNKQHDSALQIKEHDRIIAVRLGTGEWQDLTKASTKELIGIFKDLASPVGLRLRRGDEHEWKRREPEAPGNGGGLASRSEPGNGMYHYTFSVLCPVPIIFIHHQSLPFCHLFILHHE
eukprot:gb/GEZN01021116.1/.p1 GENE.gb/GEZN01021116.1/~~gb/GEZN01021116.1/.p1  ORF type:complete len:169 (+),score=25.53 gb/GEZN01021116.1/:92-598(+)